MVVLLSALVVIAAASVTSEQQKYTSSWANLDAEPILRNERLVKAYFKCLMDQGQCFPEALEMKKQIPDALESGCVKCTEKQRVAVEKVISHLFNKRHELFKQLEAKYDPKGKYRTRYTEELQKLRSEKPEDEVKKVGVL